MDMKEEIVELPTPNGGTYVHSLMKGIPNVYNPPLPEYKEDKEKEEAGVVHIRKLTPYSTPNRFKGKSPFPPIIPLPPTSKSPFEFKRHITGWEQKKDVESRRNFSRNFNSKTTSHRKRNFNIGEPYYPQVTQQLPVIDNRTIDGQLEVDISMLTYQFTASIKAAVYRSHNRMLAEFESS